MFFLNFVWGSLEKACPRKVFLSPNHENLTGTSFSSFFHPKTLKTLARTSFSSFLIEKTLKKLVRTSFSSFFKVSGTIHHAGRSIIWKTLKKLEKLVQTSFFIVFCKEKAGKAGPCNVFLNFVWGSLEKAGKHQVFLSPNHESLTGTSCSLIKPETDSTR